jgi:carbon storage regulator
MLGDDTEVQILEVGRDHVKIGIIAPSGLRILRKEIYQDVKSMNEAAAQHAQTADFVKKIKPSP